MNRKKTILTAIVLLAVILIGGMLAYFTDKEERTNVFTVGKVDITLTEATGWTLKEGSTTNEYESTNATNLTPNKSIAKEPTVENTGTNDAYVFVEVEVPVSGGVELFTLDAPNTGWKQLGTKVADNATTPTKYTYTYYYGTDSALVALKNTDGKKTVFDNVTFADLTSAQGSAITSDVNVKVTAYAIQSDNLSSTDSASIASVLSAAKGN